MVALNGEQRRLIDPATGRPFEGYDRGFAVAPVLSYAAILNQSLQVYSAIRRDDAIKFGRQDALAMERDCFLQAIMLERYKATALLKGHVEPEDPKSEIQKADAEFMQKVIERTPNFQRYKMALLYAIWFGRSGLQHVIRKNKGELIEGRPFWRVVDHSPVRGDKIEFTYQLDDGDEEYDEGTPLILVSPSHTDKIERWGGKLVRSDLYPSLLLTPGYWRERFVIHKHLTKDWDPFEEPERQGCVHGFGVRDQIFWMDWIRKEWLSNVSDFIDQIGKGCQIYPYDASNPQNEAKAIEAAKKQSRNTVIVWPVWPGQNGQILPTPMNTPMDGSNTLLELMKHMEEIEERYIIGQSGSSRSDTSGMGTHDTGFMEATKENIVRWDSNNLAETLTEQLLAPLHRWNNPMATWKLFYRFEMDKPNAAELLQAAGNLYQMNVPIKADEVRQYAGYTKPEEGDEVVSQQQDQAKQLELQAQAQQGSGEAEAKAGEAKIKLQGEVEKHKMEMESAKQKHQLELEKMALELEQIKSRHVLEMEQALSDHNLKREMAQQDAAMQQQAATQDHERRQREAEMTAATKLQQGQVAAQVKQQQTAVQPGGMA